LMHWMTMGAWMTTLIYVITSQSSVVVSRLLLLPPPADPPHAVSRGVVGCGRACQRAESAHQRPSHPVAASVADANGDEIAKRAAGSRYLRLEQSRSRHNEAVGNARCHDDVAPSSTAGVRRRIRGKSSPPAAAAAYSEASANQMIPETADETQCNPGGAGFSRSLCRPGPTDAWSSRIGIRRTSIRANCHLCGYLCRTRCAGCTAALCISCGRERRECSG
jgi:hypothetical protein